MKVESLTDVEFTALKKLFGSSRASRLENLILKGYDAETMLKWIAQTVHQAYHTDQLNTWETCPRGICGSVRVWLQEHSFELSLARRLMEEPG